MPRSPSVLRFETALDFFEALSPATGISAEYSAYRRVYRGHGRAEVPLMPSAFRRDKWDEWLCHFCLDRSVRSRGGTRLCRDQIWCEFRLLKCFFEAADREGLRLADDSQILREEIEKWTLYLNNLFLIVPSTDAGDMLASWPPRIFLSLMALAQHSRIPTRLLDLTWSPYVAAYFAATNALRVGPNKPPEALCVWGLSAVMFEVLESVTPGRQPVVLVTVPAAQNDNLGAQRGLFLLHRPQPGEIKANSVFHCAPLEERLDEPLYDLEKLVLPVSEARELLRLLASQGVHGASMFPGFEGVATSIREQYEAWPTIDSWGRSESGVRLRSRQGALHEKARPQ